LSIVTTMYRSADDIDEFYRRTVETASTITHDFEIVFVNDGSPDHSLAKIRSYTDDPRVVIVDLSRNYGHHQAIMAGLSYTRGNYIFLIDIDLEEQPEWMPEFYHKLVDNNVDVVYGVQNARADSLSRITTGLMFYQVFNTISDSKIPTNICTIRIITR
jgi:putative glycosyltransferase